MSSLLSTCGLEQQQLIEDKPWHDGVIDFDSVRPRLESERMRCVEFLVNALGR